MNTPKTIEKRNNIFFSTILKNWENLEEPQKVILKKIWNVITYKWQLQILFNLPFVIWWVLDYSFTTVHNFDAKLINYLNLPDWALSMIGFGQPMSS